MAGIIDVTEFYKLRELDTVAAKLLSRNRPLLAGGIQSDRVRQIPCKVDAKADFRRSPLMRDTYLDFATPLAR
jgi:hypothetical protein